MGQVHELLPSRMGKVLTQSKITERLHPAQLFPSTPPQIKPFVSHIYSLRYLH